jgi:hypothetical protein
MRPEYVQGYLCPRDTNYGGMNGVFDWIGGTKWIEDTASAASKSVSSLNPLAPVASIVGGGFDVWKTYLQQDALTRAAADARALEVQRAASAAQAAALQAKALQNQAAYEAQRQAIRAQYGEQVFKYVLIGGIVVGLGAMGLMILKGMKK